MVNQTKIIEKFKGKKIVVIGDIMLDRFLVGSSNRLSPEAPVPVVKVEKEILALGGAANVAANLKALGAEVSLVGVVGHDSVSGELMRILKTQGLDARGIFVDFNRITTEKTRLVSSDRQIVRIDKEDFGPLNLKIENKIIHFVRENMGEWDGVVFSDYNKGTISSNLAKLTMALARRQKKIVVVDAKPQNYKMFRGATLIAPNFREALEMSGSLDLKSAGREIQKNLGCHVLVTRGHEGMTLFCGSRMHHIPAVGREVFDIVGAGDTVTAVMSLALVSGASPLSAALVANRAASIVVGKVGTSVVTRSELKNMAGSVPATELL